MFEGWPFGRKERKAEGFFFLLGFERERERKGVLSFFLVCFKEKGSLGPHPETKREEGSKLGLYLRKESGSCHLLGNPRGVILLSSSLHGFIVSRAVHMLCNHDSTTVMCCFINKIILIHEHVIFFFVFLSMIYFMLMFYY